MTGEQCRMARAALHWTMEELAGKCDLAKRTIVAIEGNRSMRGSTVWRIQNVFEAHGIQFIGNGVQIGEKV